MFLERQLGPLLYGTPPEKLSCIWCEPEMERGIYFTEGNANSQLLLRLSGGLQIYLLAICRSNEL